MQTGSSEWDEYSPSYHVVTQASIHPIQVPASCQYVAATIPPSYHAASQSCSTQYVAARIRFDGEDTEDSSSEGNDNVGEEDLIKQYWSVIKKKKPVKRLSVRSVLSEFLGDCKTMAIVVDD